MKIDLKLIANSKYQYDAVEAPAADVKSYKELTFEQLCKLIAQSYKNWGWARSIYMQAKDQVHPADELHEVKVFEYYYAYKDNQDMLETAVEDMHFNGDLLEPSQVKW